ncbi:heat-inducible transcription repressor HrcA [Lactobacillus sp. S2-2]|uniref:heat-inducible transcriptional repressor HrcA n=1 Tax=Lactobacillus sp. S2-2 TaxID=2692917 RepID=UPI001F00E1AA|nr:heat-inducible transcriptional repressor HrcA [Lactobacillus sp. S2-2]MCF6514956.1 heat-inducible transcription repressor HrcA [Lactobacillus sp. S2-2]
MLTDRQNYVLQCIVDVYAKTGDPVGSKALVNELPINVSSATIRNEMAHLEDLGLLMKPYSSSGRVPSIDGYRYYVENLVEPVSLNNSERQAIRATLSGRFQQIDDIVQKSANILSKITNYTAVTLTPEQSSNNYVIGVKLVYLDQKQIMVILVMNTGQIASQPFRIGEEDNQFDLNVLIDYLNRELVGFSLNEVINKLRNEVINNISNYMNNPDDLINTIDQIANRLITTHLFVSGRVNLLDMATDIDEIKLLYAMFDSDANSDIAEILDNSSKEISVQIGPNVKGGLLKNYSIIAGTYNVGKYSKGKIAIIGPMSMNYPKILGLVEAFKKELENQISVYFQNYSE